MVEIAVSFQQKGTKYYWEYRSSRLAIDEKSKPRQYIQLDENDLQVVTREARNHALRTYVSRNSRIAMPR